MIDDDLWDEARTVADKAKVSGSAWHESACRAYAAAHLARYGEPFLPDVEPERVSDFETLDWGFDFIVLTVWRPTPDRPLQHVPLDVLKEEPHPPLKYMHFVRSGAGGDVDFEWGRPFMDRDLLRRAIMATKADGIDGEPMWQATWDRYCAAHLARYGKKLQLDEETERLTPESNLFFPENYANAAPTWRPRPNAPLEETPPVRIVGAMTDLSTTRPPRHGLRAIAYSLVRRARRLWQSTL
jgi:hypothetical protein